MPAAENITKSQIFTRLQELVQETDYEFVVELVDIFIIEAPAQIRAIEKALDTQDNQLLTITSHTLKGSSLNIGAKQLGAACLKLEEMGRSNGLISASVTTEEIECEFEKVKKILSEFKQNRQ